MSVRRMILLQTVLGGLLLAGCQRQAAAPAGLTAEDSAAINGVRTAYANGTLAGDWNAVADLYAEDGIYMPNQAAMQQGKAAILAWLQASPTPSEFTITPMETGGLGDVAWDIGSYSITLTPAGAPGPVTNTGHYMVLLRKQADGTWKLSHAIANSDQPPPMPADTTPQEKM